MALLGLNELNQWFFFQNLFHFLILLPNTEIYLYETGSIQLIFSQRSGYWLYNSVIFEGATLVYPRYWLWQQPEALQEGLYASVAPEQKSRYYHYYQLISQCIIVL